jgi:DNA-binding GntR family transcriptional regulator
MSSLARQTYTKLRGRIAAGDFDSATALSEPSLAREMNVSRTPVREAIRRLEAEGLLEQRAKLGTFLRRPDRRELAELFDVRLLLEPAAAARAARHRTADHLEQIAAHLATMQALTPAVDGPDAVATLRAHTAADRAFHQAVLEAADHRTIARVAADAAVLGRVFAATKDRPDGLREHLAVADGEHREVFRAIRAQDARAAARAMRRHLVGGRRHALAYLAWLARSSPPDSAGSLS